MDKFDWLFLLVIFLLVVVGGGCLSGNATASYEKRYSVEALKKAENCDESAKQLEFCIANAGNVDQVRNCALLYIPHITEVCKPPEPVTSTTTIKVEPAKVEASGAGGAGGWGHPHGALPIGSIQTIYIPELKNNTTSTLKEIKDFCDRFNIKV